MPLPIAIPIALAAGGSLLNFLGQRSQVSAANKRNNQLLKLLQPYIQGLGPGEAERQIANYFSTNPFSMGSDPILQSLRTDPASKSVTETLLNLSQNGNPFDTSSMFAALTPVRQRQLNEQIAGLRAGSGSLGQRFGTSTLNAERTLRGNALQDFALQDAQIQQSAFENAQQRRLGAAGQLTNYLAQQAQLGLAGRGQQINLLQLLGGLESQRMGQGLQAASIFAGVPAPQTASLGAPLTDIGQLLLLTSLLGGQGGGFQYPGPPPQLPPPPASYPF